MAGLALEAPFAGLPAGTDLSAQPLNVLEAEEARIRALMGIDEEKRKTHKRLSDRIAASQTILDGLERTISEGNAASQRIEEYLERRRESYKGVFEGIEAEEQALRELYSPLSARLASATGALAKLSFSIRRHVDVEAWARKGEALLDLRRAGNLKGIGALLDAAESKLGEVWRTGTADDISKALSAFRTEHDDDFRSGALVEKTDRQGYRAWAAGISEWLYDATHVRVSYSMQYEGLEIESLSPGTRGIVLLLLYLAIDVNEDIPLIIDQPEENLDPKSVYDELVGLFRTVKKRRQIIVVTHNANLIVNTDADQVIVATCGPLMNGKLPDLMYSSGSLEDPSIRGAVCSILEGGEHAFRERARRLRIEAVG